MNTTNDNRVIDFLEGLKLADPDRYEILFQLRKMVFSQFQDVGEKIMYGGIIFYMGNEMFSGIFAYKQHVTIEFSRGFLMKDPNHHLEGKGKFRRHIKLSSITDLEQKEVKSFIIQSIE